MQRKVEAGVSRPGSTPGVDHCGAHVAEGGRVAGGDVEPGGNRDRRGRGVGESDPPAVSLGGCRPVRENPNRRFVEVFDPALEHPVHGLIDAIFKNLPPCARRQQGGRRTGVP